MRAVQAAVGAPQRGELVVAQLAVGRGEGGGVGEREGGGQLDGAAQVMARPCLVEALVWVKVRVRVRVRVLTITLSLTLMAITKGGRRDGSPG